MIPVSKRTIIRCLHLVLSIPIIGYAYSPFEDSSPFPQSCSRDCGCGKGMSWRG
jgi:hypothetical protein